MTRTLRPRPPAPAVDTNAVVAQAHWCATRLVHHGWRFLHIGRGEVTALTPAGESVRISHTTGPHHRHLHNDLCAALASLGEDTARAAAHLDLMLRLRAPITRPPQRIHPWTIPGSAATATPGVRIGYWLATVLTDDYGWELGDLDASGFHAVIPGEDCPQRFTAHGRTPTTSMLLAAHLATLTGTERAALTGLLTAHQRPPRSGPPSDAATTNPPGRSRR